MPSINKVINNLYYENFRINYLSESSICYMVDGKLKFAISEERLNRVKNWYGNPINSINLFLRSNKISMKDIDCIATHGIAIKKNKPSKI